MQPCMHAMPPSKCINTSNTVCALVTRQAAVVYAADGSASIIDDAYPCPTLLSLPRCLPGSFPSLDNTIITATESVVVLLFSEYTQHTI